MNDEHMLPRFAGIPAHAQTQPRWVVWALEEVNGRPTKVPYQPGEGKRLASTSEPKTWSTYTDAKSWYLGHKDTCAGLGWCRAGNAYFFDGDNFFRPLTDDDVREGWGFEKYGVTFATWPEWKGRQPREWYLLLVAAKAWLEISPSRRGLHAVLWSSTIVAGFQISSIAGVDHTGPALYTKNRYLTVTGAQLNEGDPAFDAHTELETMAAWAAEGKAGQREDKPQAAGTGNGSGTTTATSFSPDSSVWLTDFGSDDDVIMRVRKDRRGGVLWNGNDPGGIPDSSHSGLDLALCQRIVFYGGPDPARVDRIFRFSNLFREKWEQREDYRERTVSLALENTSDFWKPRAKAQRARAAAAAGAAGSNGDRGAPDEDAPVGEPPPESAEDEERMPDPPEGSWRGLLLRNAKEKPIACLANADIALRYAPQWKKAIVLDEFANVIRTVKPTPLGEIKSWTDTADTNVAIWMQKQGVPVTSWMVHEAVLAIAHSHRVHPLREWLKSLVWDGEPRIDNWLIVYLGVADSNYARLTGAWWLGQAVARAFHPGTQADYTLVLEGPQGQKKSQALRVLAGDEYFTDQIADFSSKDASGDLQGKWVIELGEFDRMAHKPSVVKAFLTRMEDHFRPPYGRFTLNFPRQCVFAATVNLDEYFADDTGNRRFWPVRCGEIDLARLAADREQLWAEAVERFSANRARRWPSTPEEVSTFAAEQAAREELDVWHDDIAHWVADPAQAHDEHGHPLGDVFRSDKGVVTVSDILTHALLVEPKHQTPVMKTRVAKTLRRLGWKCRPAGPEHKRYRAYFPAEQATDAS